MRWFSISCSCDSTADIACYLEPKNVKTEKHHRFRHVIATFLCETVMQIRTCARFALSQLALRSCAML